MTETEAAVIDTQADAAYEAGKRPPITEEVAAQIRQRLRRPESGSEGETAA